MTGRDSNIVYVHVSSASVLCKNVGIWSPPGIAFIRSIGFHSV